MRTLLALLFALLLCLPAAHAAQPAGDRLVTAILVSRHGLRSPLVPNSALDRYSVTPWPRWPVAPGVLTARGAQQLRLLGTYDATLLRSLGLVTGSGCPAAQAAWVWTDTDQRTRASGRALADGMFPGCAVPLHGLPSGTYDPLFNLTHAPVPSQLAAAAVEQVRQCAQPTPQLAERMRMVQNLLDGCAPQGACSGHPSASMLQSPASVQPAQHGIVDWEGPLPLASSFAEDFELEYIQDLPMRSVAWGRLTPAQLNTLIALHTRYIACLDDTPALAALGASDLLAHIAATLAQAAEQGPRQHADAGAFAGPQTKLFVIVGHDSNLVGLASLLGLHWQLDGRADDTPPASALLFELWKTADGRAYVRTAIQMPSLAAMRALTPLTQRQPPLMQPVTPAGCAPGAHGCPWSQFSAVAARVIDRRFVQ